ncbi:MAG: hypothetical protein K0U93_24575 [Gammaproteobacteria bacterium]|nr:hypothetical protein [Gammaproteobacteria bacterium]
MSNNDSPLASPRPLADDWLSWDPDTIESYPHSLDDSAGQHFPQVPAGAHPPSLVPPAARFDFVYFALGGLAMSLSGTAFIAFAFQLAA